MIDVQGLNKHYDGEYVLRDLNMNVQKGSIYGLIGPNGAGKSTLLNTLAGVYSPDGGSVKINGEDVYENNAVKEITAYITDDPYYLNGASVSEMAKFMQKLYKSFSMEKFEELKQIFKIDTDKKITSFSKGMKRQAAIMLALAQQPDVLLCDECFDGLDPVARKMVKQLIVNEVAKREMTVVISSHNLSEMENLCDTAAILYDNKIIIEKSMNDIKERMHRFSAAYKPMIDIEALKQKLDVVSYKQRGSMLEVVARGSEEKIKDIMEEFNPLVLEEIELTLEDIFICEMEVEGYDFSKIIL